MSAPAGVLLLTHNLGIGGSERQMTEVAKTLDRRAFTPHVGCFHSDGLRAAELRAAGVPILKLPVTSFASFSALSGGWQLIGYIRRHGIRIVHSFDVPLNIFAAPFAWLARGPVVLTSQRAHRLLTPGLYHRLLRVTDRLADGIVVNCEFMRRHLVEDERMPPNRIHLCYNGIDTELFRPAPPEPDPQLAGPGPVIGVVCALRPEKDLVTLLEGFAKIAPAHPAALLAIVGDGPEKSLLQTRAETLGILPACRWIPATRDVARWLHRIGIFVLPSRFEALSNSLMEAMACGCCVVASRVGGNPELTGDGERGELFESGNPAALAEILDRLIRNTERRKALARSAREFIATGFTLTASVHRMEQIYRLFLRG